MSKIILPESFLERDIERSLEAELENYRNILLISGKISYEKTKHILEGISSGHNVFHQWYGGECSYSNIDKIIGNIEGEEIDIVVGIGGGKALDTAKVVADRLGKDIYTLPTIAATCANYTALSVMYHDSGDFDTIHFMSNPPKKTFVDMKTIYEAPRRYLYSGIGDTIAKYYEVFMKTEGESLNFNSLSGKKLSELCRDIIIDNLDEALRGEELNEAFEQIIGCILLTTGKVSILVDQTYNGAIAHSVCYGFTKINEVEENKLHGEIVAYGLLVQLLMEGNTREFDLLKSLYEKIELPTKLTDLCARELYEERRAEVLEGIMSSPNLEGISMKITEDDIAASLI